MLRALRKTLGFQSPKSSVDETSASSPVEESVEAVAELEAPVQAHGILATCVREPSAISAFFPSTPDPPQPTPLSPRNSSRPPSICSNEPLPVTTTNEDTGKNDELRPLAQALEERVNKSESTDRPVAVEERPKRPQRRQSQTKSEEALSLLIESEQAPKRPKRREEAQKSRVQASAPVSSAQSPEDQTEEPCPKESWKVGSPDVLIASTGPVPAPYIPPSSHSDAPSPCSIQASPPLAAPSSLPLQQQAPNNSRPIPVHFQTSDLDMTKGNDENQARQGQVKQRMAEKKEDKRISMNDELLDLDSMLEGCEDESWLSGSVEEEGEDEIVAWLRSAADSLAPKARQALIKKLDSIAKKQPGSKRSSALLDKIEEEAIASKSPTPDTTSSKEPTPDNQPSKDPTPDREGERRAQRAAEKKRAEKGGGVERKLVVVSPPTPDPLTTPDFVAAEANLLSARVPQSPRRRRSAPNPDGNGLMSPEGGSREALSRKASGEGAASRMAAEMSSMLNPDLQDIQLLASLQEEELRQALVRLTTQRRRRTESAEKSSSPMGVGRAVSPASAPVASPEQRAAEKFAAAYSRPMPSPNNSRGGGKVNLSEVKSSGYGTTQRPATRRSATTNLSPSTSHFSSSSSSSHSRPPSTQKAARSSLVAHIARRRPHLVSRENPSGVGGSVGELNKSLPNLAKSSDSVRSESPAAPPQPNGNATPKPSKLKAPAPRGGGVFSGIPTPRSSALPRPSSHQRPKSAPPPANGDEKSGKDVLVQVSRYAKESSCRQNSGTDSSGPNGLE